jgi:predicted phosphatase
MKKTVVFDFDGVIHSYTSGWKGIDVIPDEPVAGIKEAIFDIRQAGYEVAVVSARCVDPYGKEAIREYLTKNEIEVDMICKEKPPAIVYIDDRAICFDGKSDRLLAKIENFKTWYQKE